MKTLATLLLLLLVTLGKADLNLSNPLPKGQITVKGTKLFIERREVFLFGANYTFDSPTAKTPAEFAQDCLKRGENWVRFHKVVVDVLPYVEACYQVGIRSSVDVLLADGATQFYGGDLSRFDAEVTRLGPILKHPGLFMVCMVNEGGHLINPLSASSSLSILLGKQSLRAAGFQGLITDLPDAAINPPLYAGAVANLDVVTSHGYGVHPQGLKYQEPIWQLNPHFSGVSYQLRDIVQKPMLFQEIGCLFPAANRHINEAFFVAESVARGANGVCIFQAASNHDQMNGKAGTIDMFSVFTDPLRQVSFIAGALLAKTKSLGSFVTNSNGWTVENNLGPYGGSMVFKQGKQRIVVLFGRSMVDGFASHDVEAGWKQIDSFGSRKMWHPEGDWFDLGAPIASAKRVDTFSLRSLEDLPVDGTKFLPPREVGVFEISLR